jgi:hypothetical protein
MREGDGHFGRAAAPWEENAAREARVSRREGQPRDRPKWAIPARGQQGFGSHDYPSRAGPELAQCSLSCALGLIRAGGHWLPAQQSSAASA